MVGKLENVTEFSPRELGLGGLGLIAAELRLYSKHIIGLSPSKNGNHFHAL